MIESMTVAVLLLILKIAPPKRAEEQALLDARLARGEKRVGMKMGFTLTLERGAGASELYFEVACVVIVFILAGRYFEARAKRQSGAALRALLDMGAKDVAVLRDATEVRIPIGQLQVGDRFVVRPGEKVATDGTVEEGTSAIDASLLTGEPVPVEVGPGDAVTGAEIGRRPRAVFGSPTETTFRVWMIVCTMRARPASSASSPSGSAARPGWWRAASSGTGWPWRASWSSC